MHREAMSDSGDDEFADPELEVAAGDEDEEGPAVGSKAGGRAARGRGRGRGARGRGGGRAGGRGRGRGAKEDSNKKDCFAATCAAPAKNHSKWCERHEPMVKAMTYQATTKGELPTLNKILEDAGKSDAALAEWEKENPEGKWKKKLIDWAQWRKDFKISVKIKCNENEELMDVTDYIEYMSKTMSEAQAAKDFEKKWNEAHPDDREGGDEYGPTSKVFIVKNKARQRTREHELSSTLSEGSKQMRADQLKVEDRKHLTDFMERSQSSFGNQLLTGRGAADPEKTARVLDLAAIVDDAASSGALKKKKVDPYTEGPTLSEKGEDELKSFVLTIEGFSDSIVTQVNDVKLKWDADDTRLNSFLENLIHRAYIVSLWLCSDDLADSMDKLPVYKQALLDYVQGKAQKLNIALSRGVPAALADRASEPSVGGEC